MSWQTPEGEPPPDPASTPGEPVGPDPAAETVRLPWQVPAPPPRPAAPPAPDGWTRPESVAPPIAPPPSMAPPPPAEPDRTGPAVMWAHPSAAVVAEVPGAPGLRFADTATRLVAYFFDSLVIAIIATVAGLILGLNQTVVTRGTAYTSLTGAAFAIVFTLTALVYFVLFWTGGRRATPAQRLFNLQVGNAFDGAPLTLTQAVKRWLALGDVLLLVGIAPALVGVSALASLAWVIVLFISTVRNPTKQGMHDRFANSAIVRPAADGAAGGLAMACLVIVGILFAVFVGSIVALIFLGGRASEILSRIGSSV